ncbi:tRNA (N6-isopentenyl adenosine(37)-C2)-methylthiotransferase MiaB [Chloroflexota bacterium]
MDTAAVSVVPSHYYIWTIGCQMNKADSERLESALMQLGLKPAPTPKDADVVVLNSCMVRQSAEDRVVGMVSSLKSLKQRDPGLIVALMGCMVEPETNGLQARFPHVDVFMRPQEYKPLLDLLGDRLGIDAEGCLGILAPTRVAVSAYVPVIHGCDKFCSYCVVPYRRGRERSRAIEDVVCEVELLAARGVKEVTLLGQNVDSYGHDLPGRPDLADLLTAINQVESLSRVRFLTSHPSDMSQRIIEAVASLDRVCAHLNLPFQSGDDQVLQAMRRGYTGDDYKRLVERIRATVPGVSISTDLVVGFPGESEAAFQRSVKMLQEVRFDKVHVAAYSPRPGTIATRKLEDDVAPEEKRRRLDTIEKLQEEIATSINARLLDATTEVLVEGRKKGKWWGRNRNDKLVFFKDERDLLGEKVSVRIQKTSPWSLQGEPVS